MCSVPLAPPFQMSPVPILHTFPQVRREFGCGRSDHARVVRRLQDYLDTYLRRYLPTYIRTCILITSEQSLHFHSGLAIGQHGINSYTYLTD